MSEYPRVNDCLYGWCPNRRPECDTCDAIKGVVEKAIAASEKVHEDSKIDPADLRKPMTI